MTPDSPYPPCTPSILHISPLPFPLSFISFEDSLLKSLLLPFYRVCMCVYGIIGQDTGKDRMCWVPGSGVTVLWAAGGGCWELNLGPGFLQKQYMLLIV